MVKSRQNPAARIEDWRTGLTPFARLFLAVALLVPLPAVAAKPREAPAAPTRGLADNQIAPASRALVAQGDSLLAAGQTQKATDSYEAALAADPRNRRALIGLGRAAEAEGLPGKAVRFYREALDLEPNDLEALERQGMAFVERGAKGRAEANLERLKKLCEAPCAEAQRLAAAIARGPVRTEPQFIASVGED